MSGLSRLGIQSKMILLLLAVSLGSIAVMAWIGYATARASLTRVVENQLQGVRVAKATSLQTMIAALREQVILVAERQSTIDAMRDLRDAYRKLPDERLAATQSQQLDDFYRNDFIPKLKRVVEGEPVLEQYLPARAAERYLQYHYIAANPNPYLDKEAMSQTAADTTAYGAAHARHHQSFGRSAEMFGFEDLLLVDADTADIVYSYEKTTELGTNLNDGPYAGTKMAGQVRSMLEARDRGSFGASGFEAYRPNLGKPKAFAMSPIFDGSEMLGLLVVVLPMETFNKVLTGDYGWQEEGLGETGECFLVGLDGTIRSESRPMHENPGAFLESLRQTKVPATVVDRIERQGTAMCTLPVDSESVLRALRGQSGIVRTTGYRGEPVLSAYGPLDLGLARLAIVAQIDEREAQAPIRAFGRTVVVVATGMALLVTLLALLSSHLLMRPLRQLTEAARRIGAGDRDVRVSLESHDEVGELGRVFNRMSEGIEKQAERLASQVRENQDLLASLLPATALASWREGDSGSTREVADASVLVARIVGLAELGAEHGTGRALSLFRHIVEAFDEAAEKSGIEKVRAVGGHYLAVCGLSVARPDHVRRTVELGVEMARIVAALGREHRREIQIAVGIACGPLVGGVVGRRKFLYDLWGEAVATAETLASAAGSGVRVSAAVRERVGDQLRLAGPLPVPGGGRVPEMWEASA